MAQLSIVPGMNKSTFPGFSPDAPKFLRALKRNNRRDWFQPRKEKYEALIKAPMLEFVAALNEEMARFAPAYVTPPEKAVYRIYRDTRFSPDKTPYKTHVAAIFPRHSAVKREGAVFYMHFTEKELLAFAGVYSPDRDELLAYRTLLRDNHEEFQAILDSKSLRKTVGGLQGEQLSRMPKGFPVDHPAEALLRQKQWYLESTLEIGLLTTSRAVPELAKRFAAMAPMVEFLNRPFAQKEKRKKMPFSVF
jgi:TIGR02453 family protein